MQNHNHNEDDYRICMFRNNFTSKKVTPIIENHPAILVYAKSCVTVTVKQSAIQLLGRNLFFKRLDYKCPYGRNLFPGGLFRLGNYQ